MWSPQVRPLPRFLRFRQQTVPLHGISSSRWVTSEDTTRQGIGTWQSSTSSRYARADTSARSTRTIPAHVRSHSGSASAPRSPNSAQCASIPSARTIKLAPASARGSDDAIRTAQCACARTIRLAAANHEPGFSPRRFRDFPQVEVHRDLLPANRYRNASAQLHRQSRQPYRTKSADRAVGRQGGCHGVPAPHAVARVDSRFRIRE